LRYKLQRAILRKNKWLKINDTEAAADVLRQLEDMRDPPRAVIVESRIDVLLRKIEKVRNIPGNDEHQVTQRAVALSKKWKIGSKEGSSIGSQDQPEILSPSNLVSAMVSNLGESSSHYLGSDTNKESQTPIQDFTALAPKLLWRRIQI
jgi:hypothetical protein